MLCQTAYAENVKFVTKQRTMRFPNLLKHSEDQRLKYIKRLVELQASKSLKLSEWNKTSYENTMHAITVEELVEKRLKQEVHLFFVPV